MFDRIILFVRKGWIKICLAYGFLKWLGVDEGVSVKLVKRANTTKFLLENFSIIANYFVIDITLRIQSKFCINQCHE